MKKLIVSLSLLVLAGNVMASDLVVKTVENKLPVEYKLNENGVAQNEPKYNVGEIIATASSVVALGEQVYTLLQRGKPNITTDFAPISIVPKDPISKMPVELFDMDDCSRPVKKSYTTTMSTAGVQVVKFQYIVSFVYNCSVDGVGKYIQAAFIQPGTVNVGYGWDVDATMKLSGMMNHGKRADPVVGALLTIKYSIKSWRTALEKNETFHITGAGLIEKY